MFPYYAPYQFINDNEKIDGVLIDYLDLIEKKIDYKFKRKLYTNWEQLLSDAKNNKIDIVLEIQQTSERDSYLKFYSKLFESSYVIISRKNTFSGTKLEDYYTNTKTITVPLDYGIHEILKNEEPELNILTEIDDLACLKQVNNGVSDAYIGPKAVANYLIKTRNLNNLKIGSETPYVYAPSIAVQNNNGTLNQIIRKTTNAITDNEKETIFNNWLYTNIKPFYKKPIFWIYTTSIILSIIIIILLLNRYLKYLIRKKTRELIIAKKQAEESNKLKTAFIHNISHEVRTPMNGIIGFSELLNDPELTEEKQKEYTNIVIESSNRLKHIIEDIVEISNLHSEQVGVSVENTDLTQLLQTLYMVFKDKANHKNITLSFNNTVSENQNIIKTDKYKIQKILYNLIDNAIKFTENGGVEVLCEIKDNSLIFQIKDTGIGIKQKDQELIFRNFSQSEREITKAYDGLGLGLSISRKNAQLLKGNISFTSTLNQGSTFIVTLPHEPKL
ncbi:hypothetical protein GCM10022259_09130 [Aquimarina mytili]